MADWPVISRKHIRRIELLNLRQCELHFAPVPRTLFLLRRVALEIHRFQMGHQLWAEELVNVVDVQQLVVICLLLAIPTYPELRHLGQMLHAFK